jgi:NAD(P)-dependent dehydrogenase (short-subunit alcohol dehydrogenase family)
MASSRPVMVVSGAGPGMGRATAVLAARRGMNVVLAARREEILQETAALVHDAGGSALTVPADLTHPAGARRVAERTLERFGRLDVLVHSLLPPHLFKRILALEDSDIEGWRKSVEVSTLGALLMAREAGKPMVAAGKGAMVFVTATSGLQGYPAVSAHAVGKAGIHALMQCIASEMGPLGVRANAVAVGVIDGATSRARPHDLPADIEADLKRAVDASGGALRRNITETEAAEAVLYLASDDASGTTGQILVVDGGRHFH